MPDYKKDPRAEIQALLDACRHDAEVPEPLYRLLEALVERLDHAFPAEAPTRPTPSPFKKVSAIFEAVTSTAADARKK